MTLPFEFGDLWDYHAHGWTIVVTTNIGWKWNGENVMGAGIAKEAARRFHDLPSIYGARCQRDKERTCTVLYHFMRLIMFPVKPLNKQLPWKSWKSKASLSLIERSTKQLRELILDVPAPFRVAMSYPGCGNGGLMPRQVIPILEKYLGDLPPGYTVQLVEKP